MQEKGKEWSERFRYSKDKNKKVQNWWWKYWWRWGKSQVKLENYLKCNLNDLTVFLKSLVRMYLSTVSSRGSCLATLSHKVCHPQPSPSWIMPATLSFWDYPWNYCPYERSLELKTFWPTLCCSRLLREADQMTWHCLAVVSVKRTIWWPNGTFAALTTYRHSQVILCSCQIHLQEWATASILAKCFCCQYIPVY